MSKVLMSLIALFAVSASVGHAEEVYWADVGRWHLRGHIDYANPSNNACVFHTEWTDGKRIQVNVFPKADGSANITMSVYNPQWYFEGIMLGKEFSIDFVFTSHKYETTWLEGIAVVKNKDRILFRGMNRSFVKAFIHMDDVTIAPGSEDELYVRLDGTAALTGKLADCLYAVQGPSYDGANF